MNRMCSRALFLLIQFSSLFSESQTSSPRTYNIGLIYNSQSSAPKAYLHKVADYALSRLPAMSNISLNIITKTYERTHMSSIRAICEFVASNMTVVISDSGSTKARIEADVLGEFRIPVISTTATNPYLKQDGTRDYLLLMSTSDTYQSEAVFNLLKYYNWDSFSILASANDYGINGLVQLKHMTTTKSDFTIVETLYFKVGAEFSVRTELTILKNSLTRVIVLNCDAKYARTVFEEAHAIGLMEAGFVWIVTDAISTQPETIARNGSYPSWYEGIIGTASDYGQGRYNYNKFKDDYLLNYDGGSAEDLTISSIFLADAITLTYNALSKMAADGQDTDTEKLSCKEGKFWKNGNAMRDALLNTTIKGASGEIDFNAEGMKERIAYNILNFREDHFVKIGSWRQNRPLTISSDVRFLGSEETAPGALTHTLAGFHLLLGMVVEEPFAYLNPECKDTRDPTCWYGIMPELTTKLAQDLNFTFEFVISESYGGYHKKTDRWTGMIGDLLDGKTNYTAQALAISTERSKYIAFSTSFYEGGASFIVMSYSSLHAHDYFFLKPFKGTVWCSLVVMMVIMTLLMTCFTKSSAFAMHNPDSLDDMYLYNSGWVVAAGLVGQGGEAFPSSLSGRFLLFAWWFFAMVLGCMYTANLSAHLTLEHAEIPIHEMKDLLTQSEYGWGVIGDRNMEARLLNHVDSDYQKLVTKGQRLSGLEEAKALVRKGKFIFIDESSVIAYQFKNDCNAAQVNEGIMNSEWSFGFQKGSPFKHLIDRMVLVYRENGYLSRTWSKWYNKAAECGGKEQIGNDLQFGLDILSGLFYVFGIAVLISCVLFVTEIGFVAGMKRIL